MPGTDLELVQSATGLATPDPLRTSEGLAGAVVAAVAAFYVLFLDKALTAEQATAIALGIGAVWTLAQFAHAAYVRGKRAQSGGLSPTVIVEGTATGSDPGDH